MSMPRTSFALLLILLGSMPGCTMATIEDASEPVALSVAALRADSVLTDAYNPQRTGANLLETKLTTTNVNASTFGQRAFRSVEGLVTAQVLYAAGVAVGTSVKNLVYVVTLQNNVYAFDADEASTDPNAGLVWFKRPLVAPAPFTGQNQAFSGTSTLGIMGAPVIDGANGVMYMVAATQPTAATRSYRLFALDIATGATLGSLSIAGSFAGTTFNPNTQLQRAGLLLVQGRVVICFASVADGPPYHGWLFSYPATPSTWTTAPPTPQVFSPSPVHDGGGIWQSGRAPATDGTNIYFLTGNGFDGAHPELRNAFVKLSASDFTMVKSFQPSDFAALEADDQDLGSGGAVLLPGLSGGAVRVVGGGKTGVLFVHDQNLAGTTWFQAAVQQYVSFPTVCSNGLPTTYDAAGMRAPNIHGVPVAWAGPGFRRLYLWAEKDYLKAFDYSANGDFSQPACPMPAVPSLPPSIKAAPGMPGGMLALSANGSQAGTGILWATTPEPDRKRCNKDDSTIPGAWCNANSGVVKGRIYAFNAETLAPLWDAYLPSFAKFVPPTVAGGKVFVPTFSNKLLIFGLRSTYQPVWTPLNGAAAPGARASLTSWNSASRLDAFILGSTGAVLHKTWSQAAGWEPSGAWENHAGTFNSNPSATTWPTPRLDLFVRDTSSKLKTKYFDGAWGDWHSVENIGILASDPVAVARSGRLDVFTLDTESQIKHLGYDGTWHDWESLPQLAMGFLPASAPAVIMSDVNRIDVIARSATSTLQHSYCTGSCFGAAWSPWQDLGGEAHSAPAAVSWGSGRIDLFVVGRGLQLNHRAYRGGQWSDWETAPYEGVTLLPESAVSPVSAALGRLDVYARTYSANDDGGHNQLTHIAYDGKTWTWWEPLLNGGIITADPAAIHAGGQNRIVVQGLTNTTWATTRPSGVLP